MLQELEFDEFTPQLTQFLDHYRQLEKSKKEAKAKAKEELMDEEDDEQILATPQSTKSKGDDTADVNDGDQTEDEDREGEGDEEEDNEDMEE